MKSIGEGGQLEYYLDLFDIRSFFSSGKIHFTLHKYERGELVPKPFRYFYFVVRGGVRVYSLSHHGVHYLISRDDAFFVLGDTELTGRHVESNFVEADSDLYCVGVSLARYRDVLLNDNRFLRFVLDSVTDKLFQLSPTESSFGPLDERLLSYFRCCCLGGPIANMGALAQVFHVSLRHLQRTLRKLVENGKIERTGKGVYKLL